MFQLGHTSNITVVNLTANAEYVSHGSSATTSIYYGRTPYCFDVEIHTRKLFYKLNLNNNLNNISL
jgi:hypothetical protein